MGKASFGVIKSQSLLISALLTTSHKGTASPPSQTRFCSEDVQKLAVLWSRKERIFDIWSASSKTHPNSMASPKPPVSPGHLMWTQEGSPSTAPTLKHLCCYNQYKRKEELLKRALPWLKNTYGIIGSCHREFHLAHWEVKHIFRNTGPENREDSSISRPKLTLEKIYGKIQWEF